MKKMDILLVEPREEVARYFIDVLHQAGYEVNHQHKGRSALLEKKHAITLVSSSVPDMRVNDWITLHKKRADVGIIIGIVNQNETHIAADSMQAGATDYLVYPFDPKQLLGMLDRVKALDKPLADIVASSWRSKQVLQLAHRAACTSASVLITGESGTGKEVLARYVHEQSSRKDKTFVAVNCAAIPESILESVFFGHVKGAFTGAVQSQSGKFEEANGGTILLDEIGEMSPALQAKLLRVLQEREVERVGSHKSIQLDIRIIAATNKDLRHEVQKGTFREDLYYRLDVFPLHWPPLRERAEDILPLSQFFIKKYKETRHCHLAPDAIAALTCYQWPGNIRELENIIQRALVMRHGDYITAEDLMLPISMESSRPLVNTKVNGHVEAKKVAEFQFVMDTLRQFDGNRTKTAEALGVTTRALRYKLAAMRDQGIDLNAVVPGSAA